jgi:phenylacetate-CoA ligase
MSGAQQILARVTETLDKSQWESPEKIAALQRRQLAQLGQHCENHSAHFRDCLHKAGLKPIDLGEPGGLENMPFLSRRALQAGSGIFCTAVPENHMPLSETRTSGSTGEPVVVKRTAINSIDWLAATMREHVWHKRDFAGRFCAIRANVMKITRLENWGPPASLLRQTGPALGIPITTAIDEQIRLLLQFQPQILLVYPNILSALLQRAEEDNIRFPGLKQILSVGETLSPNLRKRAAAYGVEIADTYSSQEAGTIALQCPQSGLYHVMAENLIVEILGADGKQAAEGTIGRVVITDLHNYATPLIRYDIGDYAQAGPPCPCGRGLPTLKRILGRERNLILMPDGSRHWPLVGFHAFRQIAPIVQYQIVQEDREHVEMRLVVERPLTVEEESGLIAHVQKSLGHPFRIRLSYFDGKIPVPPTGKFEEFICRAR